MKLYTDRQKEVMSRDRDRKDRKIENKIKPYTDRRRVKFEIDKMSGKDRPFD
jgi:hypothetical protein